MPLQKNQVLTLRVERLSSDGSGVAHSPDGETVFIPGAAPGDEARVRIVKDCKRTPSVFWTRFSLLRRTVSPGGLCRGRPLRRLQPAASGLCR